MHLHGNEATESTSANVLFNTVKQLNLVKALDIFSFSNMKYQVCLKPNQNTTNLWMRNPQSNKKKKKDLIPKVFGCCGQKARREDSHP